MVVSLQMGWRHVLFANWPVDPTVVEPHLPASLALDTFDDQAWLSLVPFTNVDVRLNVLPSGFGVALPELNLRTYVTHDDTPGVYFFSLDAKGLLGVLLARIFHHLPYYYASIDLEETDGMIRFMSRRRHPGARPARFRATYGPTGDRVHPADDSLEHFLTERYRYYTEAADGSLRFGSIVHQRWPLYGAEVTIDENQLFTANGFDHPDTDPVHLYSPGVDTIASANERLD